jgi:hypothetical protein
MTQSDESFRRIERMLEGTLGALSDWLEAARVQENERRARAARVERARREHQTRVVMAILAAITIGFFFWLSRSA